MKSGQAVLPRRSGAARREGKNLTLGILRGQIRFRFVYKVVEIVQPRFDVFDQFLVIDSPVAVDQAVSEIEKRLQLPDRSG